MADRGGGGLVRGVSVVVGEAARRELALPMAPRPPGGKGSYSRFEATSGTVGVHGRGENGGSPAGYDSCKHERDNR